jgi:hypothetical protein
MIYLDSSVALACMLAEDRFPPDELWDEQLVSSRLGRPERGGSRWKLRASRRGPQASAIESR